ncbi:MAG: dihydropteroate synthase [Rhodospirillales bacterium]|nr:dihydropteroate synthase [Rhodospirillales bacterium]
MGIVNVTPDSFSDGGKFFDAERAISHGRQLAAEGAAILDVGGESTRPGADPVSPDDEIARVLPVVRALAGEGYCVSIDTRRARVMKAALECGAVIINDVTALEGEAQSLSVVAASQASVILMHMQGDPGTMQENPRYDDAALDIFKYLEARVVVCEEAGIPRSRIAVDPGIGFGKTLEHNLQIISRLGVYGGLGCPVVLGASRKRIIGELNDDAPVGERLCGSVAAALSGVSGGARILRVHDVADTRQALNVWQAIQAAK